MWVVFWSKTKSRNFGAPIFCAWGVEKGSTACVVALEPAFSACTPAVTAQAATRAWPPRRRAPLHFQRLVRRAPPNSASLTPATKRLLTRARVVLLFLRAPPATYRTR
ncbi:hypothetical protein B0H17DRAFT_1142995 [Mycena rosella]|uniref:Uncharacterized protein n=1 Tax=Mycena rosella TaxID=1033263 RepID=A0AAD7CVZ4_MYCRO|nr:hypothetical protein B0H17DRAFT_1142995 [Mycena rosella]